MRVRTEAGKDRENPTRRKDVNRMREKLRGAPTFPWMNHGGVRQGAGRKAEKDADGKRVHSSHAVREQFTWNRPVHVTVRVRAGLPSLRGKELAPVVLKALEAGNEREGFRLVHFSVLSNHVHLICEAEGPKALGAAMKGLNVRIARAINKALELTGAVIEERYHLEVLGSPAQVRNAVDYVLRNGEKHGAHCAVRHGDRRPCPDPLSSAAWFAHWKESELNVLAAQSSATIVRPAQCWLLREGLRQVERLPMRGAPPGHRRAVERAATVLTRV
jgi:REP element-mobilizing transposase RayT